MPDIDFQVVLLIVAALIWGVGKLVEASQSFRRKIREAQRTQEHAERAVLDAEPSPAPPRRVPRRSAPAPVVVRRPVPRNPRREGAMPVAPAPPTPPPAQRRQIVTKPAASARRRGGSWNARALLRDHRGARQAFVLAEILRTRY